MPQRRKARSPLAEAVNSARRSNVQNHSYDPETRCLDITFHQGTRYRYHDVDPSHATDLASTNSPGGFLHRHIIGKHKTTRLDD